ncbi:MAG: hypothetical protein AAF991_05245 [Pseudomonadota bacterium]
MSDTIFVICNHLDQFWTRSEQWVDGREPKRILKLKHQDEALNLLVELSAKDIELRGKVEALTLSEQGEPVLTVSEYETPTLAEEAQAREALLATEDSA